MQTPASQLLAASAVSRNGLRSSAVLVDRIAALMQAFEAPPMEEEPKVTQSFRLPPVLVERLEKEAKARGVTKTELAELALEAYFGPKVGDSQAIGRLAEEVARYLAEQKPARRRRKGE